MFIIETRAERQATGKGITESEQILMDPHHNGPVNNYSNNMNSFMALVDSEERFGRQVEYMEQDRDEQLALGYQKPNQLKNGPGGPGKGGKMSVGPPSDGFDNDAQDHLNHRMQQEKKQNSMNNQRNQGNYGQEQVIIFGLKLKIGLQSE